MVQYLIISLEKLDDTYKGPASTLIFNIYT